MTSFLGIDRAFNASERVRGLLYFEEGRVTLLSCSPEGLRASVRGAERYIVRLERDPKGWRGDCTCPAFADRTSCKHIWAAVLAARERMDDEVDSTSSAGSANSPHRDEEVPPDLDDEEIEALFGASSIRTTRARPSEWSAMLDELESASVTGADPASMLHVRYVLHVRRDRGAAAPRLETLAGRRTVRGSVTYRRGGIRPDDAARLEPADRRILSLLWGGAPAYDVYAKSYADPEWRLPADLQPVLLPMLARTGRLELAFESGGEPRRLTLDEGGAYELALNLRRDGEHYELEAFAARGPERIPLTEIDALFEGGAFVARGLVSTIDWRGAWSWIPPLRARSNVRIPIDERPRMIELLTKMPGAPHLDAEEFITPIVVPPTPILRLSAEELRGGMLAADILFAYGSERVALSNHPRFVRRSGRLVHVVRDAEAEKRLQAHFVEAGGALVLQPATCDASVPAAELPALVERLTEKGWLVEAEGQTLRASAHTSFSISSGIDWFDVSASVDFDGAHAEMPELLRALLARDRFVTLSDGSRGILPKNWLASWGLCSAISDARGNAMRVPKSQAWLLDAWLAEREHVDVDAEFTRVRTALASGKQPRMLQEPPGFRGELRPYQREGLGWLVFLSETGLGGCLADDMGLGKTVQVLALILRRRVKARGPALVVAPNSVLFNWRREAERFTPELKVHVHHGTNRVRTAAPLEDADLIVTSYGTMRQDVPLLSKIQLDCAVLDEAQSIKNDKSLAAKAARTLKADLRLALTGTPVENHLGELFSIFAFLNPGLAKGSTRLRKVLAGREGDIEAARILARGLRPFLLRRTKEQVLTELPAKTEQIIACELEGDEKRAYSELREHFRRELLGRADEIGLENMQINVLAALLRLRQAACHPGLIDPARVNEGSAKLDALLPMLDEARESGHRALVFSQFTSFLAIVRQRLDARKIPYEYLDGQTRNREERVKRFQESPDVPLFLISLKAGGLGLNLTGADYVFLLDPWWNPAVEQQAIDRTHRIGQTRPVTAYRLVARDTVEEKVVELQARKRALADALFESAGTSLRDLTRDDLEWLLT